MEMPLREYYSVTRAAELLKCKVEDLLHWASIGAISLYVEFRSGTGYVDFFGNNVEPENRNLENYTEQDFEKGIILKHEFLNNGHASDGPSFALNTNVDNFKVDEYLINTGAIVGKFSGLWALPYSFYGKTKLYSIVPEKYDFWASANKSIFISFETDEYLSFEIDDLYIMRRDFTLIYESNGKELPNYYNGRVIRPVIAEQSIGKVRKPHLADYHSKKRESILKAAIYMKVNYPDLCINNTKWAEAINEYAHKFWEDGEPPLAVDTIADLLGKALSISK
jgi:hypothetical protein